MTDTISVDNLPPQSEELAVYEIGKQLFDDYVVRIGRGPKRRHPFHQYADLSRLSKDEGAIHITTRNPEHAGIVFSSIRLRNPVETATEQSFVRQYQQKALGETLVNDSPNPLPKKITRLVGGVQESVK